MSFSDDTRTYRVIYGSLKLSVLEDPDTISVVVGENQPPSRMVLFSAGKVQHRLPALPALSAREARGETSIPDIFSQERDEFPWPPQRRPVQEVWPTLASSRSRTGQDLPLAGLYTSTFLLELSGFPPEIINPGIINNCQTTLNMRLYKVKYLRI